jgi:hypothetical protein
VAVLGIELQVEGDDVVHGGVGSGKGSVLIAVAAVVAAEGAAGLGALVLGLVQGHAATLAKFTFFH